MSNRIYLLDGDDLRPMDEQPYLNEDSFQELLEKHPDLLAGEQMSPEAARRWILVTREIAVPDEVGGSSRWSLDHLFLDQDGIPTLVEVKRSTDSRIRREVVGQMMDYAANATAYWGPNGIRSTYETSCSFRTVNPEEEITERLGIEDVEDFWSRVETNLRAKNMRLLFVADRIPTELRRIIEFMNEVMNPTEVLGVELKQFIGHGVHSVVPNVIGQTAAAMRAKSGSRRRSTWTQQAIKSFVNSQPVSPEINAYRRLFDFVQSQADGMSLGSGRRPGFGCRLDAKGRLVSCWNVRSYGDDGSFRLEIGFGYLAREQSGVPDAEQMYLEALRDGAGSFSNLDIGGGYPTFELSGLSREDLNNLERCTLDLRNWLRSENNES